MASYEKEKKNILNTLNRTLLKFSTISTILFHYILVLVSDEESNSPIGFVRLLPVCLHKGNVNIMKHFYNGVDVTNILILKENDVFL